MSRRRLTKQRGSDSRVANTGSITSVEVVSVAYLLTSPILLSLVQLVFYLAVSNARTYQSLDGLRLVYDFESARPVVLPYARRPCRCVAKDAIISGHEIVKF